MKVLFVHGALVRDGRWFDHPMPRRGLSTGAVVLPSCEGAPGELGDMYADAAAVSDAVAATGGPVILCGHSYGGTVITEAGAGEPNMRHLIYITSVLPDLGQSHADAAGAGPAPWVHPQRDGTAVLHSDRLQELFFADCDDDTFAEALTRAAPQPLAAFGQPVRQVACSCPSQRHWHRSSPTRRAHRADPRAATRRWVTSFPRSIHY